MLPLSLPEVVVLAWSARHFRARIRSSNNSLKWCGLSSAMYSEGLSMTAGDKTMVHAGIVSSACIITAMGIASQQSTELLRGLFT